MNGKTRTVYCAGLLRVGESCYFLLSPRPIEGDSWEDDQTYRFYVTDGTEGKQIPYHLIVRGDYSISYAPWVVNQKIEIENYEIKNDEGEENG